MLSSRVKLVNEQSLTQFKMMSNGNEGRVNHSASGGLVEGYVKLSRS